MFNIFISIKWYYNRFYVKNNQVIDVTFFKIKRWINKLYRDNGYNLCQNYLKDYDEAYLKIGNS